MDPKLAALLGELETFGREFDAKTPDHDVKMRNITHEVGEFLTLLIRATRARRILEIGTSNGYSTLWLAQAVQATGGTVTTLELLPRKAEMARANFARANLLSTIHLHLGDAGAFLKEQPSESFDFIFLDSERHLYVGWWPDLQRVLASGGLMIADNAVSHAAEIKEWATLARQTPGYLTSLAPVGKGEFIVLKPGPGAS
ncbi:MAG: O-methyltransferase [Chloroflexi bacterium]|nr:O-methyltransferase [Chloroflexota bacterium]